MERNNNGENTNNTICSPRPQKQSTLLSTGGQQGLDIFNIQEEERAENPFVQNFDKTPDPSLEQNKTFGFPQQTN